MPLTIEFFVVSINLPKLIALILAKSWLFCFIKHLPSCYGSFASKLLSQHFKIQGLSRDKIADVTLIEKTLFADHTF